jgi:hypothetical protein
MRNIRLVSFTYEKQPRNRLGDRMHTDAMNQRNAVAPHDAGQPTGPLMGISTISMPELERSDFAGVLESPFSKER